MNALQNLKHYLAQRRLTHWCDNCKVSEAKHFIPRWARKGVVGLCDTCYAWRRNGWL